MYCSLRMGLINTQCTLSVRHHHSTVTSDTEIIHRYVHVWVVIAQIREGIHIKGFLFLHRNISGVIRELSEREKFCSNFRISGRSFLPNFGLSYKFYTFSLLPQLKIGKSTSLGRLFLPNRPLGWPLTYVVGLWVLWQWMRRSETQSGMLNNFSLFVTVRKYRKGYCTTCTPALASAYFRLFQPVYYSWPCWFS